MPYFDTVHAARGGTQLQFANAQFPFAPFDCNFLNFGERTKETSGTRCSGRRCWPIFCRNESIGADFCSFSAQQLRNRGPIAESRKPRQRRREQNISIFEMPPAFRRGIVFALGPRTESLSNDRFLCVDGAAMIFLGKCH